MKVGCYTLDLYCTHEQAKHPYKAFPIQYIGRTQAACLREAKRAGWTFGKDRETCPYCNGKPQEGHRY